MDHGPAVQLGKDNSSPIKAKIGVYLFLIYSLIYTGFVAIAVISPKTMGVQTLFGLNLACFYGFGLIILALIMGLIYNHICTGLETKMNQPEEATAAPEKKTDEESKGEEKE